MSSMSLSSERYSSSGKPSNIVSSACNRLAIRIEPAHPMTISALS